MMTYTNAVRFLDDVRRKGMDLSEIDRMDAYFSDGRLWVDVVWPCEGCDNPECVGGPSVFLVTGATPDEHATELEQLRLRDWLGDRPPEDS